MSNNFLELIVESEDVYWASHTAYLKTKNTYDSWQKRTDFQRFINIFFGDLAKNLIKENIILSLNKEFDIEDQNNLNNFLIEYDLIRQDGFLKPDKFDLLFNNNKTKLEIEVKSSIEKYIQTFDRIDDLNNRRIIVNVGNEHEHFSDVVIQVIFMSQRNQLDKLNERFKNYRFNNENIDNYLSNLLKIDFKSLFVGYINKKQQLQERDNLFQVKSGVTNNLNRNYIDFKIKDSKSPKEFIENLNVFFNPCFPAKSNQLIKNFISKFRI